MALFGLLWLGPFRDAGASRNAGPSGTAGPLALTPTVAVYAPLVARPAPAHQPAWLNYLNRFRAEAALPALAEDGAWSAGGVLHSRYMVMNDLITHREDPGNPWYTPEGDAAGRNGNIAVSSSPAAPDEFAIDLWLTGPFHAVAILDPQLHTTGYGAFRQAVGLWQTGATLDVGRGQGPVPPGAGFPLPFPRDGGQTWLLRYNGNEWPDPLTGCAGYTAPSGPPLILQLGSGSLTPSVTASSLTRGGTPAEHCVFDETNYQNPDAATQTTGRIILNLRDAVVIMPRAPLLVGHTYTASITADGQAYSWSFTVIDRPAGIPSLLDHGVMR